MLFTYPNQSFTICTETQPRSQQYERDRNLLLSCRKGTARLFLGLLPRLVAQKS